MDADEQDGRCGAVFTSPRLDGMRMPLAPAAAGPYAAKARRRASLANQLLSALSQHVIGIVLDEISYAENTYNKEMPSLHA